MEVSTWWKIVEFPKIQLKWIFHLKHFARLKQRATLRKLFSLPQPTFCKVRKTFGSLLFLMPSELRFVKWARFFERSFVVKWLIFFTSFCWLWDFNLKVSDDVHWNVRTNIKKLFAQNNILKKESQVWDFESFTFWYKFRFLGTEKEKKKRTEKK